jgi:ankyrin repeat protein
VFNSIPTLDVNTQQDKFGVTALHIAAQRSASSAVVDLLLSKVFHIQTRTQAHTHTQREREKHLLVFLLGSLVRFCSCYMKRIPINAKDRNGHTALHFAAKYGSVEVVSRLLNPLQEHSESDNASIFLYIYSSISLSLFSLS